MPALLRPKRYEGSLLVKKAAWMRKCEQVLIVAAKCFSADKRLCGKDFEADRDFVQHTLSELTGSPESEFNLTSIKMRKAIEEIEALQTPYLLKN